MVAGPIFQSNFVQCTIAAIGKAKHYGRNFQRITSIINEWKYELETQTKPKYKI